MDQWRQKQDKDFFLFTIGPPLPHTHTVDCEPTHISRLSQLAMR